MQRRWTAISATGTLILALAGCGGGNSPTTSTPTTTLMRDGFVALDGKIGGTFTMDSSPLHLSGGRLFACGDVAATIPYRETAGGSAAGAGYETRILEWDGGFTARQTGTATNIAIGPNETGTITIKGSACPEWKDRIPPRVQLVINFTGKATGMVSTISGTGPLTVQ